MKRHLRALVCGGRDFTDREMVFRALDELRPLVIIEGGARGADALARQWALDRGVKFLEFPADWQHHGKKAGPIRNAMMLEEGKPDMVIAFAGGRGTDDMLRKARKANLPTVRITR